MSLIQFFFELCLLRRAPQDLPASSELLGLTLAADLLMGMISAVGMGLSYGMGLSLSLVGIAFMLALLYGALYLLDRLPRFRQSATALLGSGALLEFVSAASLSLLPAGEGGRITPAEAMLSLAVTAWSLLVIGHILRHTFDLRLGQGVGIAVLYGIFSYAMLSGLFSGA